ncbi:hypothetical protein [uncultured Lamprocystis sp.]|jgi:hypothetical protein|uniref:hypothetical protein n=1 Tax=uncultured Lamprocystis sp. TaxID=543132 RepID=UPI0025F13DAA|nr:hypothetical protein [uncultured Lamprocystis sp.]
MYHSACPDWHDPGSGASVYGADSLSSAAFAERIERFRSLDLSRALTGLILELEDLQRSTVSAETRYAMLRVLKRAVLHVAAALTTMRPVRCPTAGSPTPGPALSLEQRLYAVMASNCLHLLHELGRGHTGYADSLVQSRQWAVRNAFRFLGRQILCAIRASRLWPAGAWQSLHELFVYLVMRGSVRLHGDSLVLSDDAFDPESAYKQLLLIGLLAELVGPERLQSDTLTRLGVLAKDARLVESDGLVGEFGLILVEVSHDRPPRLRVGSLDDPFRGWVLRVPREFESLVTALEPTRRHRMAIAA